MLRLKGTEKFNRSIRLETFAPRQKRAKS